MVFQYSILAENHIIFYHIFMIFIYDFLSFFSIRTISYKNIIWFYDTKISFVFIKIYTVFSIRLFKYYISKRIYKPPCIGIRYFDVNDMMSYNILLEYDKAKKQAKAEYAFGQSVSESIKSSKQKSPRTSSLSESSSLEESHSLSVAASLCIASRRAEPLRFFLLDFEAGGYGDTHVASSKSPNTYFSGQGQ